MNHPRKHKKQEGLEKFIQNKPLYKTKAAVKKNSSLAAGICVFIKWSGQCLLLLRNPGNSCQGHPRDYITARWRPAFSSYLRNGLGLATAPGYTTQDHPPYSAFLVNSHKFLFFSVILIF